jgi:D-glycero-alpha-D-manno-heptose-7-phosphate kinase
MIASSAPLRISYLGGGTDYQNYFSQYGGLVLGASINMKVYVFLNELSKVAEENVRFTYRKIESVTSLMEIKHPVVREVLKIYAPNERLNIATFADLPGKSGLGSSSAFTVALITALQALAGNQNLEPKFVAENAINIERKILNEVGGIQDHYHATCGNLRSYRFGNFETKISEPYYSDKILQELSQFHQLVGNQSLPP